MSKSSSAAIADLVAGLNRSCHCISVDSAALESALEAQLDGELVSSLRESHPNLFALSPVFVTAQDAAAMTDVVRAVERVVGLETYRRVVLDRAPAVAAYDPGALGTFYGYDFHIAPAGPRLIEINTNAGGALLNLHLARAQRACCPEVHTFTTGRLALDRFEGELLEMFRRELELALPGRSLRRVVIVDDEPERQFLYPELRLFERLLREHGVEAWITSPEELELHGDGLRYRGQELDLVYNRLTDFYFESPANRTLRQAYERRLVAVTPHPRGYALYADKRNLGLLSDPARLEELGADPETIEILARSVPRTRELGGWTEEELWAQRKSLFLKPATGYGSRGAYDGARLTRKVCRAIVASGDYVAQEKVPPSERFLIAGEDESALKVDVRATVYEGRVQLLSARLYRGQTTNLRTAGGGLATVFVAPPVTAAA